jgi:hypothetical protein
MRRYLDPGNYMPVCYRLDPAVMIDLPAIPPVAADCRAMTCPEWKRGINYSARTHSSIPPAKQRIERKSDSGIERQRGYDSPRGRSKYDHSLFL